MPRKLPPYVCRDRSRHGKIRYYYRRSGRKTRLPDITSPDFNSAYARALEGHAAPPKQQARKESLEWLIKQYKQSSAYMAYSIATRRQRDNIFRNVLAKGNPPYRAIMQSHIRRGREDRSGTPAQARNFLDAMRGLFQWALDSQLVEADPTAGVKNPKRQKGPGFPEWTSTEVEKFRNRWPIGTHERVWFEVLLGTGARRGDAVKIGRQHIKNGMIQIETEKKDVWAFVPVLPVMQEALNKGPTGDLTLIVGKNGRNLRKESFGNMFRAACDAAGVKKSAHGLRKMTATEYANFGLTEAEMESVFGWKRGSSMASYYTKNADRQRLAEHASNKLLSHPKGRLSHRPKK